MILAQLGAKPLPTVGDIVALTTHTADNRDGLRVVNDVHWRWKAHGDHKLEPSDDPNMVDVPTALSVTAPACTMSNRNVAVTAVQLGIEEVKRAYELGKASVHAPPMATDILLQQIRQHPTGLTTPGNSYGPEQLVPTLDTRGPDQGTLNWMVPDLATLWVTRIRTTKPETYGDFIANDMRPGGQMGGELDAIKAKLDEEIDPFPAWLEGLVGILALTHGHLFPRRAFEKAVLQKLRNKDTCFAFLMEIIRT